jgi:hypothetical protein
LIWKEALTDRSNNRSMVPAIKRSGLTGLLTG